MRTARELDGQRVSRIGLLLPATNSVMGPELWAALWPCASVHSSRLPLESVTADAERRMLAAAPDAAATLSALGPRVTVFGCTSAGGILGRAGEKTFLAELSEHSRSPVVSVLEAVTESLRHVGARSVDVFTPYVPELSDAVADSLRNEGFVVENVASLDLSDNESISNLAPRAIVEAVTRTHARSHADAIFVSCTNLRAASVIREIREATGKPVVTSNQAVVEQVMRILKGPSSNAA